MRLLSSEGYGLHVDVISVQYVRDRIVVLVDAMEARVVHVNHLHLCGGGARHKLEGEGFQCAHSRLSNRCPCVSSALS